MDNKDLNSPTQAETIEFELEPLPDAMNDDSYDGGFHVAPRARRPRFVERSVSKRSAAQMFTFD
ncbi:MAG: hypothetical protein AAF404_17010 [Pseudomonadota bacterium]